MGFLATSSTKLFRHYRHHNAIITTQKHQENLLHALAFFAVRYGRLPRPSIDSSGLECSQPTVQCGIIPYQSLGLSSNEAQDGFGHWLSYIVEKNLTTTHICYDPSNMFAQDKVFCRTQFTPGLTLINQTIKDQSHSTLLSNPIAFFIISHGPLGGYWREHAHGGLERSPIQQGNEAKRTNSSIDFFSNPITIIQQNLSPTFDDTLIWITRHQLLAVYAKRPCP